MPLYDYERADGTIFEAFKEFGNHKYALDKDGNIGKLVWINPPYNNIPIWHQSAPNEDQNTIDLAKRAADPNDSVREVYPGMDNDLRKIKEEKNRKQIKLLEENIGEAIRDVSPDIPA